MTTVLLTGATGFVGDALIPALLAEGCALTVFTRDPDKARARHADAARQIHYVSSLEDVNEVPHAIINLAGEGIADKRWSDARKRVLRHSRIGVTEALAARLDALGSRPAVVISGSAVGYYGPSATGTLTETAPAGHDFAARLCADWEAAARRLADEATALYWLRIGVVLGRPRGFLGRLEWPFRLGLGGPLGHGRQMLSWIDREDLVQMVLWCLTKRPPAGAYNATAPQPVSNQALTRALGRALNRPTLFRVPAAPMRLILGELSQLLFEGQAVLPARAEAEGFVFKHPSIDAVLTGLFGRDAR